jgi:integrase
VDGQPISPEYVSKRLHALAENAGLRPVRLHDLRHGAASLRLAAGIDIAVVSKQLGHSTITVTADTYSHMLPASDGTLRSGRWRWCRALLVTSVAANRRGCVTSL